jgi:DNA polymerase I-like protein with 3'-5' exonuclease and polymerase domains
MRLALAEVQAEVVEKIRAEGMRCWLVMTIHDELIGAVDEGYGELCRDMTTEIMERVLVDRQSGENWCRVKIKAEGTLMQRWTK